MRTSEVAPAVSIVMPIRGEWDTLLRALTAIAAQRYDGRLELVIASAGDNPHTRARVAACARAAAVPWPVRILSNPAGSASAGLNAAFRHATGAVIVRVDGRCLIAADYVARCVETLRRTGAAAVGGPMRPRGETPWAAAVAVAMTSRLGTGGAAFRHATTAGPVETVYLGAWWRTTLRDSDGFDERLLRNQDDELSTRLRRAGGTVWLDPRVQSEYLVRPTWRALWRQYLGYGRWKPLVVRMRPSTSASTRVRGWHWRQWAPPVFVAGCVLTAGAAALGYLLVAFAVTMRGVVPRAVRARVPVALLTMVTAYGVGIWMGILTGEGRRAEAWPDHRARGRAERRRRATRDYTRHDARERGDGARWRDDVAGRIWLRDDLTRATAEALARADVRPATLRRVLDVGCGTGGSLRVLRAVGCAPDALYAVDLLPHRAPAGLRVAAADAVDGLPLQDRCVDLVCLSTCLSALPGRHARAAAVYEARRVLRPGGVLVVYDIRLWRPWRRDVRRVGLPELRRYWPEARMTSRVLTPWPPLVRLLTRVWPGACDALARGSWWCGHRLTVWTTP